MLAPRPCTATAAATRAGAGPGPPPRVVSSPAARAAAVGSRCHASVLTSPLHVSVKEWRCVDERTRGARTMLAPRPCTATAAATRAGAGPGPPPRVVSSPVARSAAVGIGSHASVLTSLHHTVRVHDWSTTVPNMCKHSYLGPYFSSSTTRESK